MDISIKDMGAKDALHVMDSIIMLLWTNAEHGSVEKEDLAGALEVLYALTTAVEKEIEK